MEELHEKASPELMIFIVGNKIDLDYQQLRREEVEAYCAKQALPFFEVSAKMNTGIEKLFKEIAKKLPCESTNVRRNA